MTTLFIEESKSNGLGISLLLFVVVVCSLFYRFYALVPQGGQYERERWAKKQSNKRNAARRAGKAQEAQRRKQEDDKEHREKERQQKPLNSQASLPDFNLEFVSTEWLKNNFSSSYESLRRILKEFNFSAPDVMSYVRQIDIMKLWPKVKDSDLVVKFLELLDYVVAIGWIKKIELSYKGLPLFYTNKVSHHVTFTQIMEKSMVFGNLLMTLAWKVYASGDINLFFESELKSSYDDEYSYLKSNKVLIDLGRGNEITDEAFDRRVQQFIDRTLAMLNEAPKSERAYYASRLTTMREIQSARTLDKKDDIREKPYGILLYGGSGVGKSSIVSSLLKYVLKVNGKDSHPRAIITLNQEDAFQSEFRTYHKGVILDDIANKHLDFSKDSPATPIIMFLNNIPMAALNPNAEMKGNVMIEPDVVCGTTNVKNLKSNILSNEPISINRRFEVTITQKVKSEYQKERTAGLDGKKITHMATDVFPDYGLFTVEDPYYAPDEARDLSGNNQGREVVYAPRYFEGEPLIDVDIYTLIRFLKEDSREHFAAQEAFVANQRAVGEMNLCKHDMPEGHCRDCDNEHSQDDESISSVTDTDSLEYSEDEDIELEPGVILESQWGVPDYKDVMAYLYDLETSLMEWWTQMKMTLLTSTFGPSIIAYLVRQRAHNMVRKTLPMFGSALSMVLIFAALMVPQACNILLILVCGYGYFLWIEYQKLKEQVKNEFLVTNRPSDYFKKMDWSTKRNIVGFFVVIGLWKLLSFLAKAWKKLPTAQAAAPITLTPDAKPYQLETEFWDVHARERQYKIGDAGVTDKARTTTHEQINHVVGKRLKVVIKTDGTQVNALPLKGNVMLLPNHFVRKTTDYVQVRNIGGSSYMNLPLSQAACERIPGTDLAVWYCPGIGNQKDLTEYYPKEILDGKKLEVYTLYNTDGTLKQFPKMMASKGRVVTTDGGIFSGLNYTFPEDTFGGLCMATLIGNAKGTPFIAGHHLAGRGTTGAAGFVTRPQIEAAIEKLGTKPGVLISHSAVPMETQCMGVDFGPLTPVHEKCPTKALPATAKIRIHGTHNQPRSSGNKSRVVTSLISKHVAEVMDIKKEHGPPQDMGGSYHKEVDIAGKVDTAVKFDTELTQKAYVDYCAQLDKIPESEIAKLGKMSDDANLAGMDGVIGINAMNFSTSIGFPCKGPKTQLVEKSDRTVKGITCPRDVDPIVLEEVKKMEAKLLKGESINAIFKGALKDEPVKLTKKKCRVFAAANFAFVMLVRKYYLSLAALCQRNKILTECAVGTVVQSPEWTELYNHIGKHGWDRAIAGDYAKFDGRMSPQFMLMAFKLLIRLAEKSGNYDADDLTIMRGIATEISYPTYDYFGTLVQFMGSNPSGHPLTVIINSLVNSLYMRYTYYAIARKKRWWKVPLYSEIVSLMTYGDDNIMTVKKGYDDYNHTAIAAEFSEVGITYTMAEKDAESVPFVNLKDASFLKHFAVYDEELGLYRSPVEDSSIAKMLHTHLRSEVLSKEQSSAEAIQNVALKYFENGKEVYDKRVEQLREVAKRAGLSTYVGPIMSYEERMQWYKEKFCLDSSADVTTQ